MGKTSLGDVTVNLSALKNYKLKKLQAAVMQLLHHLSSLIKIRHLSLSQSWFVPAVQWFKIEIWRKECWNCNWRFIIWNRTKNNSESWMDKNGQKNWLFIRSRIDFYNWDEFYFRWLKNGVIKIGISALIALMFNHLNWNPSEFLKRWRLLAVNRLKIV